MAARALGARDGAIVRRHILPNTVSPLIVQATISFPLAILAEAALSYLGLGTQPPNPSWGLMLREAQNFLAALSLVRGLSRGCDRARPSSASTCSATGSATSLTRAPADARTSRRDRATAPVAS